MNIFQYFLQYFQFLFDTDSFHASISALLFSKILVTNNASFSAHIIFSPYPNYRHVNVFTSITMYTVGSYGFRIENTARQSHRQSQKAYWRKHWYLSLVLRKFFYKNRSIRASNRLYRSTRANHIELKLFMFPIEPIRHRTLYVQTLHMVYCPLCGMSPPMVAIPSSWLCVL